MRRQYEQLKDHFYGPAGSVLLHVVIVFLLIKFVSFSRQPRQPEVEIMLLDPQAVDLHEVKQLSKEIQELTKLDLELKPDTREAVPTEQAVSAFQNAEIDLDMSTLDISDAMSPLLMKGLYAGRTSSGRDRGLRLYGGSAATERAVLKALEWLKKNQEPDGSWKSNRIAMTGLGLLAFLAHGETPGGGRFGETVEKALNYLTSHQHDNGYFGAWPPNGNHSVYAHAIATYALSEAYGLTRAPILKFAMDGGISRIIEGQQLGGGWDYNYNKTSRRDTSVVGWHVQALKAAYLAGCSHPNLRDAMSRSIKDLKTSVNKSNHQFQYAPGHSGSTTMTGIGVLALQFLGQGNGPEVQQGLRALEKEVCSWDHRKHKSPAPMYGWYYITQAKFHQGGHTWDSWNVQFARTLVRAQAKDGHWDFPAKDAAGHKEHGSNEGPVFSTTLGALMLQVYYRNLPTFKQSASEQNDALYEYHKKEKSEEVRIEIL
ncbi:MAG: prenyltransferase/squalene oxidase repeat-containing protein [Verrucomicrobiota bacterium]